MQNGAYRLINFTHDTSQSLRSIVLAPAFWRMVYSGSIAAEDCLCRPHGASRLSQKVNRTRDLARENATKKARLSSSDCLLKFHH